MSMHNTTLQPKTCRLPRLSSTLAVNKMQKQIWDIKESDIENYPVWIFPMSEDNNSDEATVRPVSHDEVTIQNTQIIVAAELIDCSGLKEKY